jgi:succinyl-diaminopimelate desuccinylase
MISRDEVFAQINEADTIEFLSELVRLKSCNPPGNEAPVAKVIAHKMEELGISTYIVPLEESRANVVGTLRGRGEKPALLFNGHLDTVPPGELPWEHDPYSAEVLGGRLYGRGAADMKSGIAAMVMAAGALARSGVELAGDLIVVGTAGEEIDSLGARSFLESGDLKGVGSIVIGEPSNLQIFTAHKGALWLQVSTQGKIAHGSMPDLGVNAIMHMTAFLNRLVNYHFSYQELSLLSAPTLSVGTIAGGVKTNVVPDRCVATIDIRTVPGQEHSKIIDDVLAIAADLREELSDFHFEVEVVNDRAPVETSTEAAIVQAAIQVAKEVFGQGLEAGGVNYYTDASVLASITGIPTIIYGPGEPGLAHQADESVELEKLAIAAKFYVALALKMLA